MWLHTEIGARILNHYELFRDGARIVLHHHERWDGKGYPAGLAGTAIPLGSRIVAVADAFDAMTSNRPYRDALAVSEAIDRLRDGAGSQWDPDCVDVFNRLVLEGGLGPITQAAATVPPRGARGRRTKRAPVEVER
jgi:HD-GYP domain-containing protein (c-di-GMP phosphodiesterase class II)